VCRAVQAKDGYFLAIIQKMRIMIKLIHPKDFFIIFRHTRENGSGGLTYPMAKIFSDLAKKALPK